MYNKSMQYTYKIFFTITFNYRIDEKKFVTKSFKSDVDVNSTLLNKELSDANIYKLWSKYALVNKLKYLNPPASFDDNNVSDKKLIIHRIVNLNLLTEVF